MAAGRPNQPHRHRAPIRRAMPADPPPPADAETDRPGEPPAPARPLLAAGNLKGALFVTLCCGFIAASTLCAKGLGAQGGGGDLFAGIAPLHPLQVAFGRFLFGFLVLLPFALWRRPGFAGTAWRLHTGRVIAGWLGVSLMFAAVAFLPLADATALSFLNPLFAMLFALVLLGERVGRWRWLAAAIAFAGVAVITQPGSRAFDPAALLALGAAASIGAELIFIKRLSVREPALRILVINNGLAALIAGGAALFVWRPPDPQEWALLAGTGVFMVSAQALNLRGMAIGEASFLAPFFYTTLLYAALYDWLVFDALPAGPTVAGGALIVAGALLLGWRERRAARRARQAAADPHPAGD